MPMSPEYPSESPRRAPFESAAGASVTRRRHSTSPAKTLASVAVTEPDERESGEGEDPLVAIIKDLARSAGPAFVVSLAIHIALLVALAFVVIRHQRPKVIPTTLRAFNPAGLESARA